MIRARPDLPMPDYKFHIVTFGCKINQYESQQLREAWEAGGGVETDSPKDADYILINSCAITARAERNARNAVFRLRVAAPSARIILCGCAAQFYEDFKPRKKANWALPDLCVSQGEKQKLLAGPFFGPEPTVAPLFAYKRSRPVVKIQDGCSQNCSYCIVPQTRGPAKSRARADILAECRNLAIQGYGELVLSGINLRQYRCDGDFWDLLKWLDGCLAQEFGQALRLRISSIDPAMLADRSLAILAECRLVCPHLHISLQHGSDKILRAMRRGHYSGASALASCLRLREIWPLFGLGADFIAGFPGETEADFSELLDLIEELPLTYAHVFPYSRRQNTIAASLPGQIAKKEKDARAARLRDLVAAKRESFLTAQLGLERMNVVIDGANGAKERRGVNEFYAPCVLEPDIDSNRGIINVAPVGVREDGLLVKRAVS